MLTRKAGAQAPAGLAPLALASPQAGEQHALRRIETLVDCLCRVLSTPTSEKAGNVPIPVGDIVELGNRLVLLNADAPVRERQDPAQVTLVRTLLPRLQLAGCQLLAQLAVAYVACCLLTAKRRSQDRQHWPASFGKRQGGADRFVINTEHL